mmetsp:Transcript_16400/g.25343  ORF Transcript_16400/g.25343 Transcript_16400/m.25343 type:complete len:123 (-) Transcript_16400:45-413(-)|eukprot:CAMPEP_0170478804 /NCGR_PEP_ID=MMETSP0208-20121228/261_1 /TAXON_ID=197538 /ORGANISM="Strombidium inclinatum, Strain S3" /LENGTH=122 /DNA_ID=CAMNT_0010751119 /DNA_START=29 /DNA_END=397 /DNA_ORIENTATION=-
MADVKQVRQIKIKTGSLKRNMKDYTSYKNEEQSLQEKLSLMQTEGKDEHDIRKMQEQVQETSETLATCKPRIENAIDDLESCIATFTEQGGESLAPLKETEEWQQAEAVITEAKAFVEAIEI